MAPCNIYAHCWQFWHQVHQGIKWCTSNANIIALACCISQLEEHPFLWYGHQMGLWQSNRWSEQAKLNQKALTKYQQPSLAQLQHSPHKHIPIKYAQITQKALIDTSKPLAKQDIKYIQDVVVLLHYGCVIDPTLAVALGTIASHQAHGIQALKKAFHQFFDHTPWCSSVPSQGHHSYNTHQRLLFLWA